MAQIFVSHSKRDRAVVDFLARVAAGTKVRLVFEELERIVNGDVTPAKIRADIERSNAVLVVVSAALSSLPHTRDWVVWESGVATNRDIWVLEPATSGKATVITPILKHYVRFEPTDAWFPYVRQIVESYDDSHFLPAILAGGGIGAHLGKGEGAVLGAAAGLFIAAVANTRPTGIPITCPHCASSYSVHLPVPHRFFRCPVCNSDLQLPAPASGLALRPSAAG